MLAIEREVFGNVHGMWPDRCNSWRRCTRSGKTGVAARRQLEEVLAIGTKRYGEADWRVAMRERWKIWTDENSSGRRGAPI